MIKKIDLVQQFELLTKQEIKNYQDSLNNVLQSLHDLKQQINDSQNHALENHALLHSHQTDLETENQKLSQECKILRECLERFQRDQQVQNEKALIKLNVMTGAVEQLNFQDKALQEKFEEFSSSLSELSAREENHKKVLQDNIDDLLRRFRSEIQAAKEEILNAPTESSEVRADLEQQIAMHKVDVCGIMRELRIYKADNIITEKKIEHLYTLIGRLDKSQEATP